MQVRQLGHVTNAKTVNAMLGERDDGTFAVKLFRYDDTTLEISAHGAYRDREYTRLIMERMARRITHRIRVAGSVTHDEVRWCQGAAESEVDHYMTHPTNAPCELLCNERGEWFYIGQVTNPLGSPFALEAIRARRVGLDYMELARRALAAGPGWLGWFCGFTGIPQHRVEAGLI